MSTALLHAARVAAVFVGCVGVLAWLHLLLAYHERTKEKVFWWAAALSLLGWTYFVSTARMRW